MPKPYSLYYLEIQTPIENLIYEFFNDYKGRKGIVYDCLIPISDAIDNQISTYQDNKDAFLSSFSNHYYHIENLEKKYGYMGDCKVRMQEKDDAATIIYYLCKIKKDQDLLKIKCNYNSKPIAYASFRGLKDEDFNVIKNDISYLRNHLKRMSNKPYSDEFKHKFYNPAYTAIRLSVSTFDLYEKPIKEKVQETSFNCLMYVIGFFLLCLFFYILANIMCN